MPQSWPEGYQNIKDIVHSSCNTEREIVLLRQFTEGKSTAQVFLVDVEGKTHRGHAILKLDVIKRWGEDEQTESELHKQVERITPDFSKEHFPKFICSCEYKNQQTALLCSIAGDDYTNIQPLFQLHLDQQKVAVQLLSRGLLDEWNQDYRVDRSPKKPQQVLKHWLGYRLHSTDGKIYDFLEKECDIDPFVTSFNCLGKWFPNPYSYAVSHKIGPQEYEQMVIRGRIHGDLHGFNSLIKIKGRYSYDYYIIDLALYEEHNYLFYDHAYLELSHLIYHFKNFPLSRWSNILNTLVNIQNRTFDRSQIEPVDYGILLVIGCLREEINRWINKKEKARKPHIEGQAILARVAAGLNFVNKNVVLETLTLKCDKEAHFWNHLGRHHSYVMQSSYETSEKHLRKAIELDSENDVHHHALGMIYRKEIHRKLKNYIRKQKKESYIKEKEVFDNCAEIISQAENSFTRARVHGPESEYGYITHVQLLIEVIERFKRLSTCKNYQTFLNRSNPIALWCRDKISEAEEILRKLKLVQGVESTSNYTKRCRAKINQFYGNFELMLSSLQELLQNANIPERISIRRMIINSYYNNSNYSWTSLELTEVEHVHKLASENLEEGPFNTHDFWMWFNAYRRVKDFSIIKAISKLNGWAKKNDLEAYYYLYILHFLHWRDGILKDESRVLEYIRKCQNLAGTHIKRTYSHEWLTTTPKYCPILQRSELGKWDDKEKFFQHKEKLIRMEGLIKNLKNAPQAGKIAVGPFEAFFVPGAEFLPGKDENTEVSFYLAFSYDGLRAWKVESKKYYRQSI
jgi:hypothetical protein